VRPPPKNSRTPHVDQQLRTVVLKGKSIHAIAARLRCSIGAVRSRANLLGLSAAVDKSVRDRRNRAERPLDTKEVSPGRLTLRRNGPSARGALEPLLICAEQTSGTKSKLAHA
jgi:hypothetical protein